MQVSFRLIVSGLVLASVLVGCQSSQNTSSSQAVEAAAVAEPVEVVNRHCGQQSDLPHGGLWLITSQAQLDATGSQTLGDLGVDFAENDLVVVGLGEQSTGGYWVCVGSIQQVGDTLYVQGTANAPSESDAVTQELTNPYCATIVAKTGATKVRDDLTATQGQAAAK